MIKISGNMEDSVVLMDRWKINIKLVDVNNSSLACKQLFFLLAPFQIHHIMAKIPLQGLFRP